MADEFAWIIERADPENPGCLLPNSFLGIKGSFDGYKGGGVLGWLTSASDGLRFARQKDAAMFIGMMEMFYDNVPHHETLPGLRSGDPHAIAVEHSWSAP